jgi:protein-tyrosine-phosphatase
MAEALLGVLGDGAATAASAGSHPKSLHPHAVRVMKERGVDISRWRTKSLDELRDQQFDIVVTLCDRVREACPEFAGTPRLVHWSIPDPSTATSTDGDACQVFRDVADDLATRIRFLLRDLPSPLSQLEVKDNA